MILVSNYFLLAEEDSQVRLGPMCKCFGRWTVGRSGKNLTRFLLCGCLMVYFQSFCDGLSSDSTTVIIWLWLSRTQPNHGATVCLPYWMSLTRCQHGTTSGSVAKQMLSASGVALHPPHLEWTCMRMPCRKSSWDAPRWSTLSLFSISTRKKWNYSD